MTINEHVRCDWQVNPSKPEDFAKYPDLAATYNIHILHAPGTPEFEQCDCWLCVCGNTAHRQGFYACDGEGTEMDPDDNWAYLWCCDRCGRIIKQGTGEVVSKPATLESLCDEYAQWNKAQGLNLGSADDHYFDESLTEEQRVWLRKFGRRWERAERVAA